MPKFVKLKLNDLPNDEVPDIQWRLVIDNLKDLDNYHSLNATLNMEAFMSMERDKGGNIKLSHTGAVPTRTIALERLLHAKFSTTPEGQKVYPIIEVALITDKKHLGMIKCITNHGAIQINEAGGYCDLNGFIKTWNAEILEEIEKPDFGFPVNDAPLQADTIILENSHRDYTGSYLEKTVKEDIKNCGNVQTIYSLREVDHTYLFKCLSLCKNIATRTQLQDDNQLDQFMKMFKKMPPKNVYLYVSKDVEERIRKHEYFAENNYTHNIKFMAD